MCGPIGLCSDAISPIDIIIDEGFSHRRRDKPARRSLEVIREKAGRTAQYNGGDGEAEIEERGSGPARGRNTDGLGASNSWEGRTSEKEKKINKTLLENDTGRVMKRS